MVHRGVSVRVLEARRNIYFGVLADELRLPAHGHASCERDGVGVMPRAIDPS